MLVDNVNGNFAFIRGIGAFSSGAIAQPGFEIVHAALKPLPPLSAGFELVQAHLGEVNRPLAALCGMELRIPKVLTPAQFEEFNRPYIEKLASWRLLVDDTNPVARTNVALEVNPITEPCLAGFYYTMPSTVSVKTIVLAGAPEIKSREGGRAAIVASGDTSTDGMRQKAECVLAMLSERLAEMRMDWSSISAVNLYTVHNIYPLMATTIAQALGVASRYGVNWINARPPVTGLDLEMDARAIRHELVLR
ncbi:MAG: 2-amino-5-chloromuconate deaminase CnbZ [Candidatus Binataceae bacterium]